MSDYLDKIQTQKKDGTPLATVPFRDSEAREDITTIQNELTTDTTTIEGNPLNFTTLSAQNAKSTILSVEPIQDLHGYDKPWVGGAGKNKLPLTVSGIKSANPSATWNGNTTVIENVTWTILTDDDGNVTGIKANGNANNDATLIIYGKSTTSAADITFTSDVKASIGYSGSPSTARGIVWGTSGGYIDNTDYTVTANSSVYGFGVRVARNYTANNIIIYPMIRLSTESDATFQPYTNECSISGRTEIGILGCGDNIYDYNNVYNGYFNTPANVMIDSTAGSKTVYAYLEAGSYRFEKIISSTFRYSECDSEPQVGVAVSNIIAINADNTSYTFTLTEAKWVAFFIVNANYESDIQRSSEILASVKIYNINTDLTINLGQTVYGGTLDVENGVLVVEKANKTYNGGGDEIWYTSSAWEKTNTAVFYGSDILDILPTENDKVNVIYNLFDARSRNSIYVNDITCAGITGGKAPTIRILKSIASDINAFKNYLNNNNLQIVYPLETPITINLTPHTINLLKGVNNISTDGDKITLTYRDGSVATLADLLDLEKKLSDEEPYGFIEHMSILDPAQRIEYIGKNKNYKPVTVNLSGDHLANYNDWHDFFVLKENKPYMIKSDGTVDYALDPNDYTKKFDGSASDVADTTYTGGAFSWIPKIYKYEYVEGSDRYVYLSQKKLNDNYEAVGFIDENGLEHDGVWIPMFYGTEITQSDTVKIMSLATGTPSQSRDTATQKTYIENFSSQAKFFGGPIVNVLADLLIMLGKNSDIQAVFGTGNMSGGNGAQYMKANACLNGGAFYGSSTNTALNKAFHSLVLLTQNQWQRDPYTLCYKGEYIVSPYYKYDLTGASYVNTGVFVTPPSSNNWVYPNKSVSVPHWGAIPVGPYSGSTTTGWADGQYTLATQLTDTTVRVVRRFGSCDFGRIGGVRCVHLGNAASVASWNFGASPFLLSKNTKLM